ncbi:PKD domain-containing protein [Patescibacteria group bacterium]|nr:PKD domain-containing protein [Patescibacteria group bacterium]MBU1682871.1 PKD domain-containing protein [Patescibacteria group bacterium]MBU1935737.1 PKD domain-containing protein [Patescibacteria group bacterium]
MKNFIRLIALFACLLISKPLYAQDFNKDLSINSDGVRAESNILVGRTVRVYATVTNNSDQDLFGVVKFYDESKQEFIGTDQPISVLANKTDDVFVDWTGQSVGSHNISVRVVPWNSEGDDPSNNKVTKAIYVDTDSDGDGIGDSVDNDDDNDGTADQFDAFPYDPSESMDTDADGIGDNADTDDDNDGIADTIDLFPLNTRESVDSDDDGVGDNTDAFPNDPTESFDNDGDGIGDSSDINNQNHGPIPEIETENTTVSKGDIVTFNALNSRDPDGDIVTYEWYFDDGQTDTGVVIDHVFENTGNYNVILKVTDNKGEYREGIITIKVIYKWQTIALIAVTILLIILLLGRKSLFPDKKKKKVLPKRKK